MRSFFRLALIGILLITTLFPSLETAAQTPTSNQRFGIVSAHDAPDAVDGLNAGWEIVTLRWDELQPNGPTDLETNRELDDWLSTARTQGREVVAVVIGTPAWATSDEAGTGVPRGLYLPVSDPGNTWGSFMSRAVSYYGAKGINRWVIWRNPDAPTGRPETTWDGSIEEYYQMVKVAYLTGKTANPNAVIHLGGVGEFDPNWFSRFLDIALDDPTAVASNYYFDVATLHVYDSPEKVYTLMQNHFFVMDSKGIPLKEVWINELNARPAVDPDTYDEGSSFREHPNTTLDQQAAFIIQGYALAFAANRGARIAVYRLADDLETNEGQGFGLVREDGTVRPAYAAYNLAAEQFDGFVFARRVEIEDQVLVDYVRLTFQSKVTHVLWAMTEDNATITIPARTTEATLIDSQGNRWVVEPEGGSYEVVVGGADCNDPVTGCLIGGAPWILVEDGIEDAANATPPDVEVAAGGSVPTPDPDALITPTSIPPEAPTSEPTADATQPSTAEPATEETSVAAEEPTEAVTEVAEVIESQPTVQTEPQLPNRADLEPRGVNAVIPYVLMGLGLIAVAGGAWYFVRGHDQLAVMSGLEHLKVTQVNERIEFMGEVDESLILTQEHPRPDFPEDDYSRETATHERPEFPDEVEGYEDNSAYEDTYDESVEDDYSEGSDGEYYDDEQN